MEALQWWQWASFESLYFQNALVVRCIGLLGSTPDYRQIGLPGYGKVAQIPNSSNRGEDGRELGENWIFYDCIALLYFAGCKFPKKFSCRKLNYASISSCRANFETNFHRFDFNWRLTKFNNTKGLGSWEAGHVEIHLSREKIYHSNTKHQLIQMSKYGGHFDDSELKSHRVDLRRYAVTEAWYLGGNCNWN